MRLNKEIKTQIVRAAVTHALKHVQEGLHYKCQILAEQVRVEAFGGVEAEKSFNVLNESIKLRTKPDHFRQHNTKFLDTDITFNFNGMKFCLPYRGIWKELLDGTKVEDVYKLSPFRDWHDIFVLGNTVLGKKVVRFYQEVEKFNSKKEEIEGQVLAVVNSCTTVKKLLEVWPEGEQFIPAKQAIAAKPPAIETDALNKLLGV